MPMSPEPRLAYFALDVPHKGQASHIHIKEIIDNLRVLGWRVDLFAPRPVNAGSTRTMAGRISEYSRVIWRAIRALPGYDALYVRAHPLAWPVTMMARRRGMTVVQEVNGVELDVIVAHPWLGPFRKFMRWLYVSQYRVADRLFPVTNELGQWLKASAGHDRITVSANAANTDIFRPYGRAAEPFVVFFGGLTPWHGVGLMLDALRDPQWPAGVTLVVIGSGSQEQQVRDAVAAGLPVRWLGYQPYEKIPELISGAIAGLIPITNPRGRSSTGISPLKLYETMACGIPAIVTDLPGQAEVVRAGDCGIVIPCDDARALAGAVADLAHDPDAARGMGKRGAEFARTQHSWLARARVIDQFLRSALTRPLSTRA